MSKWQKFSNRKLRKQEPKKPRVAAAVSPRLPAKGAAAAPSIPGKKD